MPCARVLQVGAVDVIPQHTQIGGDKDRIAIQVEVHDDGGRTWEIRVDIKVFKAVTGEAQFHKPNVEALGKGDKCARRIGNDVGDFPQAKIDGPVGAIHDIIQLNDTFRGGAAHPYPVACPCNGYDIADCQTAVGIEGGQLSTAGIVADDAATGGSEQFPMAIYDGPDVKYGCVDLPGADAVLRRYEIGQGEREGHTGHQREARHAGGCLVHDDRLRIKSGCW